MLGQTISQSRIRRIHRRIRQAINGIGDQRKIEFCLTAEWHKAEHR